MYAFEESPAGGAPGLDPPQDAVLRGGFTVGRDGDHVIHERLDLPGVDSGGGFKGGGSHSLGLKLPFVEPDKIGYIPHDG